MTTQLSKLSTYGRVELVHGTNHSSILTSDQFEKAIQEVYDKVKKSVELLSKWLWKWRSGNSPALSLE